MRLDDGRVMTEFITAALAGRPLRLDAGGEQTRSFCYIDDMMDGLLSLMVLGGRHSPVNLGTDEEVKLIELARLVVELAQSSSDMIVAARRSDDPMQRKADTSTARALLAWAPKTPLKIGVRTLVDYLKPRLTEPS